MRVAQRARLRASDLRIDRCIGSSSSRRHVADDRAVRKVALDESNVAQRRVATPTVLASHIIARRVHRLPGLDVRGVCWPLDPIDADDCDGGEAVDKGERRREREEAKVRGGKGERRR